jgi:hypothetical protein
LAACTPVRSPEVAGESLCIALARRDYDRAKFVAGELMSDMQLYSDREALKTFTVWVASQPCAKDVTLERWEEFTQAPVREVEFVVDLDGSKSMCTADFHMRPPWVVTFHDCQRI